MVAASVGEAWELGGQGVSWGKSDKESECVVRLKCVLQMNFGF